MKRIKQIFLFLIPTLIVALVCILFNQQNIFATDDPDSASIKIEASDSFTKHLSHNHYYAVSGILGTNNDAPILISIGNAVISAPLASHSGKLFSIKNRSPPMDINA